LTAASEEHERWTPMGKHVVTLTDVNSGQALKALETFIR
jgi:hypothetical protein